MRARITSLLQIPLFSSSLIGLVTQRSVLRRCVTTIIRGERETRTGTGTSAKSPDNKARQQFVVRFPYFNVCNL